MKLNHIIKKARLFFSDLRFIFPAYHAHQSFLHPHVPYYSQWESPELAGDILAGKIQAEDDPHWQNSGALSPQEYALWSWNACGMACLKMILADRTKQVLPLVTLAKKCLTYGGYKEPLQTSPGLFYQPFCTFVKQEYQLSATPTISLTWSEIITVLASGGYVIASVNAAIHNPENESNRSGGHLVLIIGYNKTKKTIIFHNPSGRDRATQRNVELPYPQFQKFFAHRGIIVF